MKLMENTLKEVLVSKEMINDGTAVMNKMKHQNVNFKGDFDPNLNEVKQGVYDIYTICFKSKVKSWMEF